MSPCVTFLEATVDMLWSIIRVGMALMATLIQPPSGQTPAVAVASPAVLLASFTPAADVSALVARLQEGDPAERVMATCELRALGSEARDAIAALVDRLSDSSPVDPAVCGKGRQYWWTDITRQTTPGEEAAAALVATGTAALPSLVTATRSPQWVARRNAVWALGALDDRRGVTPALVTLRDSEAPVRRVAAWALGVLHASEAVPALIAAIDDQDADVRSQAAWALGAIRDERGVDGLVHALNDGAEQVRAQAAWALGVVGSRRASTPLAAALKDSSAKVRRQAAWALGSLRR